MLANCTHVICFSLLNLAHSVNLVPSLQYSLKKVKHMWVE